MSARVVATSAVLAVVTIAVAACAPKPGKKCEGAGSQCTTADQALVCVGEVWTELACRGAGGCRTFEGRAVCDQSVAEPSTPCLHASAEDRACTPAKDAVVVCRGGRFAPLTPCRGPKGCGLDGKHVTCDESRALPGDACTTQDASACSVDGARELACVAGRFVEKRPCRGARGCSMSAGLASCDQRRARPDDACQPAGITACSTESSAELVCEAGRFRVARLCKKGCEPGEGTSSAVDCR